MLGTPEGTRTPHLLLRRQLLYPDELLARIGASDGNRTHAHSLEGCCTSRYTTPALSRSASAIKFYHMVSRMSRIISHFCPNSSAIFAKVLRKVFANGFTARGWAVARGRRERESYGWKMECLHAGHHTREGHAASVRRQADKGCDTAMTKSDFFDSLRRKAPEGDFIAKQPLRVALRRPTSPYTGELLRTVLFGGLFCGFQWGRAVLPLQILLIVSAYGECLTKNCHDRRRGRGNKGSSLQICRKPTDLCGSRKNAQSAQKLPLRPP